MSIEKNKPNTLKHAGVGFTTILNPTIEAIKDPAALGIYCYLASKPNNWTICYTHLMNHFDKGKDFVFARMSYLKKIGLLKSIAIKDSSGRVTRWETVLYNTPQVSAIYPSTIHNTENTYSGDENHNTDFPPSGGSATTNKGLNKQIKDIDIYIVDSSKKIEHYADDPLFMRFYSLYPNKQKPHLARKAFYKIKPDQVFVDFLCADVEARINNNWKHRPKHMIPHPSTYLNSREFEGDIEATQAPEQGNKKQVHDNFGHSWTNVGAH